MPGIAHCIGRDILLINASTKVGWIFQVILSSSLKGKPATSEEPIVVAYDQVHYEGLVPDNEDDQLKLKIWT